MLLSLYLGNSFIKIFAVIAYGLRIIIVIIWGSTLMLTYDSHIGVKIGSSSNKADQVALYFVMFIAVREITLVPVLFLKQMTKHNDSSLIK